MKYNNIFNIGLFIETTVHFLFVSTNVKAVACVRLFPVLLGATSNETSFPHHHVSFYSCLLEMVLHNFFTLNTFPQAVLGLSCQPHPHSFF